MSEMIRLTIRECEVLYALIDELSGGNAESVFSWDETDTLDEALTSACVKIYRAAKKGIPLHLLQELAKQEGEKQ